MKHILKCKAILVSQNKRGWVKGDICKCIHTSDIAGAPVEGTLSISEYNTHESNDCPSPHWKAQHLYFVSNDEIRSGDWFLHTNQGRIYKATKVREDAIETVEYPLNTYPHSEFLVKIIASTDADKALGFPKIPESFIKEYVASNGNIADVELERYEVKYSEFINDDPLYYDDLPESMLLLKLTETDEVIIVNQYSISNITEPINYEAEVKKVYPNAYHVRDCGGFPTHEIRIPPIAAKTISKWEQNEQAAWKSAYEKINQK